MKNKVIIGILMLLAFLSSCRKEVSVVKTHPPNQIQKPLPVREVLTATSKQLESIN